jgi:hypothetical protein
MTLDQECQDNIKRLAAELKISASAAIRILIVAGVESRAKAQSQS